jgi:pimeloyl-ACP methyl ester carboxylesterase
MRQSFGAVVCRLALAFILCSASAAAMGLNPAFDQDLLGPEHSTGVIVWNHGRSLVVEDSESPTPPFLRMLREGGWDVLRFDRPRDGDSLTESTRHLVDHVAELKHKGYRRVVLAGQSFGAFLALWPLMPRTMSMRSSRPLQRPSAADGIL